MENETAKLRLAEPEDLPALLDLYEGARAFMRRTGNLHQWENGEGPNEMQLRQDIRDRSLYVLEDHSAIHGAFFFSMAGEPNYDVIREGSWESDAPYGVLHRVARDAACHSFLKTAVDFALRTTSHLRIDTHRDNKVMQHAILSCGFSYRGIINLADGSERLAYERV